MIAAVPLTFGTASAGAFQLPGLGGDLPITSMLTPQAVVAGTVTQVNGDGTFQANAYAVSPFNFLGGNGSGFGSLNLGGFGNILGGLGNLGNMFGLGDIFGSSGSSSPTTPTTTPVTISTDSNTLLLVNGHPGSVSDLAANDNFMALMPGWPWDSIQTLTGSPATFISAQGATSRKDVYAFVGTVTGVDTSAGTVMVNLTTALPSGLAPSGSSATFTVGDHTLIIGDSSSSSDSLIGGLGASLGDVRTGDIVAGGLIAPAGDTLAQVEALPLSVLLDFPAPSGPSGSIAKAKARALKDALALLVGKSTKHSRHHHHRRSRHHRRG
jgi:hypothetical protein